MAEWRAFQAKPNSMAMMASLLTVELIRSIALLSMSLRKKVAITPSIIRTPISTDMSM